MLVIAGIVLGGIVGALVARKRGGAVADMVQYGVVHAILFGLVAAGLTILLLRLL